ncbi:hypothetical protein [Phormidium sp. CCY1219]|uniref:hypothetical protein n=1 Tax=Phormidium sp. CCY1219 TaxID=2886104 RepID=UPI002D1F0F26|nr:hypothetical protein [Phormidium sp. CCY1219]MEB3831580.1 hypothetical protein [Phormidium sp. CCY1219]
MQKTLVESVRLSRRVPPAPHRRSRRKRRRPTRAQSVGDRVRTYPDRLSVPETI